MREVQVRHHRRALIFVSALTATLLLLTASLPSIARAVDKMSAEDVVAKHLESIGSAEARSSAHSRVAVGTSHAVFKARNRIGAIDGRVVLGSIERKILFAMSFPSPDYPSEKFGFNGKNFTVGYLKPGVRSTLGGFILIHDTIFKEGLVGGTLSSAWPFLNLAERKAKLEYAGTEKLGGQLVHKLIYSPNKGSDLSITLYFDAKTFQHVRTQYERVVGARISAEGIDNQANQREIRYKMSENFSDYKKEGELNLPHSYTLQLDITRTNGYVADKWEMNLSQFMFGQAIDEKGFDVEAN